MKKNLVLIICFLLVSSTQSFAGDYVVYLYNASILNGCDDGKIDLIFTGGRPPFDVEWTGPNGFSHSIFGVSGNNVGEDISNLVPGNYTLRTTDARCGVRVETFTIGCTICMQQIITDNLTNKSCGNLGSIDIHISNTSNPNILFKWYKFIPATESWQQINQFNAGPVGGDLTGLDVGKYRLDILDNGCSRSKEFTIIDDWESMNGQLIVNKPVTTCSPMPFVYQGYYTSSSDGIICTSVTPSNIPYTILWSDGFEGACRYDLPPGTYSASIVCTNGDKIALDPVVLCCCSNPTEYPTHPNIPFCSETDAPEMIFIEGAQIQGTTSANSNDGEIHVELSGQGAVRYQWSVPGLPNSGDLTGLAPGTYCVTVTNLCSNETENECFTVANCDGHPVNNVTGLATGNTGNCNGWVNLNLSALPANSFQLSWSNGGNSNPLNNLCGGIYTVKIETFTGCSKTLEFTVCNSTALEIARFDLKGTKDCAPPGGFATVYVAGGTPPYSYIWEGPLNWPSSPPPSIISHDQTAYNILYEGDYGVTVTDACGNTSSDRVFIYCYCTNDSYLEYQPVTVFTDGWFYKVEVDAEELCFDKGDSRLYLSTIFDEGLAASMYDCQHANSNPYPLFEIIWPDNTSATITTLGWCTDDNHPLVSFLGPVEWKPDAPGSYTFKFIDDYGCEFTKCVSFGEKHSISDLYYEPLIKYQPSFYDPNYLVRARCRKCFTCSDPCGESYPQIWDCGNDVTLEYTSLEDPENPCKGGIIRCPATNEVIVVDPYVSGVAFIDWDNPHVFEGTCRYDVGCLFPEGTLGFSSITDPIYVETTLIVSPCGSIEPPINDDCTEVYEWEDEFTCYYDVYCAETGEQVDNHEMDDNWAPYCISLQPPPAGSSQPIPVLVQICLRDKQPSNGVFGAGYGIIDLRDQNVTKIELENYESLYGYCKEQYPRPLFGSVEDRKESITAIKTNYFNSRVFPTNFDDRLNIEINSDKPNDSIEIIITNVYGQVVFDKTHVLLDHNESFNVSLNELNGEGIFFLTLKNTNGETDIYKLFRITSR